MPEHDPDFPHPEQLQEASFDLNCFMSLRPTNSAAIMTMPATSTVSNIMNPSKLRPEFQAGHESSSDVENQCQVVTEKNHTSEEGDVSLCSLCSTRFCADMRVPDEGAKWIINVITTG